MDVYQLADNISKHDVKLKKMKKIKILVLIITGIFFITSCSKDDELDQTTNDYPSLGTIKFYNNVVNLDNQSNTSLTQITNTTLTLNETTQISSVKVNDFLIGAPSTLCPTGFLRKVLSIIKNGQTYTFNTQPATLDEVIEECNISEVITNNLFNRNAQTSSVSTSFDVVLFDGDANTNTENDQAKITGSLELTPKLIFEIKKKKGESLKSGYIKAGVEFEIQKTFDFTCKASLVNFEVDKPFGNELRGPTFLIGGVIWVTPTLKFSVGMKGGVSANMKVGTQEISTYKIFKELNNGAFTDVQFEKSYEPNSLNIDFTGNASAEVYLKAKYSLKVYEVVGLNVSSKIYLKGDANVSATNLTQVNYCTKWGLKGATGVDLNVFGSDILSAEIENQLYEAPLPTVLGVNPCGVITLNSIPTNGLVAKIDYNGSVTESINNVVLDNSMLTYTMDRKGNSNSAGLFQNNFSSNIIYGGGAFPQIFSNNGYSISLWLKTSILNTPNYFFELNGSNGNSSSQLVLRLNGDKVQSRWYKAPMATIIDNMLWINSLPRNISNNEWHHICVTYNNNSKNIKIYFDKVLISDYISTQDTSNDLPDLDFTYQFSDWNNYRFSGSGDDYRFYNRPLSEVEIQELFNE